MNSRPAQFILFVVTFFVSAAVYILLRQALMGWFVNSPGGLGLTLLRPFPGFLFFLGFWLVGFLGIIEIFSPNSRVLALIGRLPKNETTPTWPINSRQNARVRKTLIANMRLSWTAEKSLNETIHIALSLTFDPTKLQTSKQQWDRHPDTRTAVPAGKPIWEIFAESGRSLLILGAPGSGKTYTLIQLARELLQTATPQNFEPIPVILNLSSWGARRPPLNEWLVEQMFLQYGIARKVTPALLKSGQLTLLLDGLDELDEVTQEECVKAINRLRGYSRLPMVVCSRTKAYDTLATQLKLTTAVVIQPLSDKLIARTLTDQRLQLSALYKAVQHDCTLKELAQTPLFLSLMALAYRGYFLADFRPSIKDKEARQRQLFQLYLKRTFGQLRDGSSLELTLQSLDYLTFLSQQLTRRSSQQFFFEDIQPDWLPPNPSRRLRLLAILTFGLVGGQRTIKPVEELGLRRPTIADVRDAAIFGLIGGVAGGLGSTMTGGLICGLVVGLVGLLINVLKPLPSRIRAFPGQGINRSSRNALIGGLGVGVGVGLVFGLGVGLLSGISIGLGVGLAGGLIFGLLFGFLFYGGSFFIRHHILRWQLNKSGLLPHRLQPFLDAMVGRLILKRNGPSYRFVHPALQNYFATMPKAEMAQLKWMIQQDRENQ
ncbi:MAG: NACHT domain-containing protein, partial [Candidatus Promineifilaceae bacterium]